MTEQQQARAENLVAITLIRLPQWADPAAAEAAGYHTIGDGGTGYEHLINWSYIDDDKLLDPDFPESLVYNTQGGKRTLEAAMYMLKPGSTLDSVPDVGGPLTTTSGARRAEELELDVVGVAEDEHRSVDLVGDG